MPNASPVACEKYFSHLEGLFSISVNDMRAMIENFYAEMERGLSGDESSLKMIPSFIDKPKGDEEGQFLALDLGGTNFRVLSVRLDGKRNASVPFASKFAIPQKDMQGTGIALFDFIAGCIDAFLTENHVDRSKTHDLAFTFSFPVEQSGIDAGKLIVWTKGFTATGVEGRDVILLLNEALRRKGIDCINITALANDTVGTLAARSYTDPDCDMGVIMGTGTNACYREVLSKIEKLNMVGTDGHMIVNMEWGNFDKVKRTGYDRALDKASVNPGAMFLEKMVSGMYMGEIMRLVLMDFIRRGLIFVNEIPAALYFKEKGSFKTEDMSRIEGDRTDNLADVTLFFERKGFSNMTFHDKILFQRLCRVVSTRAARLGAAAISAVLTWMDPKLKERHTVGIDGSLFEKYPGFKSKMTDALEELHGGKAKRIVLVHSKDGSGKGAAIIAAVAVSSEAGRD